MAPMATAMPPSDIRLAVMPGPAAGQSSAAPPGAGRPGTSTLRKCSGKIAMTIPTTSISSSRVRRRVSRARVMRVARS